MAKRVILAEDLTPGQRILAVVDGESHARDPLHVMKVVTSEVGGPHFKVLCHLTSNPERALGKTFWTDERLVIEEG